MHFSVARTACMQPGCLLHAPLRPTSSTRLVMIWWLLVHSWSSPAAHGHGVDAARAGERDDTAGAASVTVRSCHCLRGNPLVVNDQQCEHAECWQNARPLLLRCYGR